MITRMAIGQGKVERYTPHRWAVGLACATFPLIWVGGLVTTYDAGMAVPDWPSTFGYNLFLYPWTTWLFGPWDLFIEHGHRLLGALVGLVTIGLLISVLRRDHRRWMKILAVLALALVILQGCLGGARVLFNERLLALIHGCVGPLFFAFVCGIAVFTSRFWRLPLVTTVVEFDGERAWVSRVRRYAILTSVLIYGQLIVGAHVRHVAAEALALPSTFRVLVMFHLIMAAVVVVHVGMLAWATRHRQLSGYLRRPVALLSGLMLLQMILGPASWVLKYGWPLGLSEYGPFAGQTIVDQGMPQVTTVTAHVATASLVLALAVVVMLRAIRFARETTGTESSRVAGSPPRPVLLNNIWFRWGQLAS